jgi:threonine/homoserine/homoserine lactone efflux protein
MFFRGLVIGFLVAAPVGPIGLLCIQRTLTQGRLVGFVSGLGAASADAMYGMIAAFGLTLVSAFLARQSVWLGAVGGLFLCYLGVRTLLAPPVPGDASAKPVGLPAAFGSTLLLTLTNPMTIFAFAGILAGAGLASGKGDVLEATVLVAGVFFGSAAWWLLLSGAVSLLRRRVTTGVMVWVNRVAGALIVGFGVLALSSVWFV